MAITGTGTKADPLLVHSYDEIKTQITGTPLSSTDIYVKLANDINCNDYGDVWGWETIALSKNNWDIDLDGHTIKNIMIKSGNALFSGQNKNQIIHNGKILNVFNNGGASVINGNGLMLKDISMSVNGSGLTSYGFQNALFKNCAMYYKSSKLQNDIIYFTSSYNNVVVAETCDFYFDVNNMNDKRLIGSYYVDNYDNCRFGGSLSGQNTQYYLLGCKCINSVIEINAENMTWTSSSKKTSCITTSTGIINTEILPDLTGGTSGLTACTTAQMRDADYLNSIGFTVVKVGE